MHPAALPSAAQQPQPIQQGAAAGIDAAVAAKQQEPFVVPDPNNFGGMIEFSDSLSASASSTAASSSGFIAASFTRGGMIFGRPASRSCAAAHQPFGDPSPIAAANQTLALL